MGMRTNIEELQRKLDEQDRVLDYEVYENDQVTVILDTKKHDILSETMHHHDMRYFDSTAITIGEYEGKHSVTFIPVKRASEHYMTVGETQRVYGSVGDVF